MSESFMQQQLLRDLYQGAVSATGRVPGAGVSYGQLRFYAMRIAEYLGWEDDEIPALLHSTLEDSVPGRLAIGYGASMMLNTGNKYGLVMIVDVLKSFSGEEVGSSVAELLEDLEKHVVTDKMRMPGGGT